MSVNLKRCHEKWNTEKVAQRMKLENCTLLDEYTSYTQRLRYVYDLNGQEYTVRWSDWLKKIRSSRPHLSGGNRTIKSIKRFQKYLQQKGIKYVTEKKFDDFTFDFYLEELGIIIEFIPSRDGFLALRNENQTERIIQKTDYCITNGLKLLRIDAFSTTDGYDKALSTISNAGVYVLLHDKLFQGV